MMISLFQSLASHLHVTLYDSYDVKLWIAMDVCAMDLIT